MLTLTRPDTFVSHEATIPAKKRRNWRLLRLQYMLKKATFALFEHDQNKMPTQRLKQPFGI
jgi:hypothetical protein